MSDHEQDSVRRPFHREGDAVVFDPIPDPEKIAAKNRESEAHEFQRHIVETNKKNASFNRMLLLATFCTIVVGIWQGTISQRAANAARDAVIVASKTLTEAERSNAQQRLDNIAAAKDAKVIADKSSVQADKALQASIDNFHGEQRAWLSSDAAVLLPVDPRNPDSRSMQVVISNIGRQPATEVSELYNIASIDSLVLDTPNFASIVENPNICQGRKPANQGRSALVIFPGSPIQPTYAVPDWFVSTDEVSAIYTGCFTYKTFGKFHHTAFCYYFRKGHSRDPKWSICKAGTSAD